MPSKQILDILVVYTWIFLRQGLSKKSKVLMQKVNVRHGLLQVTSRCERGCRFPKLPCSLFPPFSAWGTLSHTRKLPAVTHVLHLLAAWKVTSQQCYLAWVAAPKEPLVQWGSEIRPSLDFECSKRVGLPMVWILKGIWNREAQPFEIRTNASHLVKNHLKLDKHVQISKSLVFK